MLAQCKKLILRQTEIQFEVLFVKYCYGFHFCKQQTSLNVQHKDSICSYKQQFQGNHQNPLSCQNNAPSAQADWRNHYNGFSLNDCNECY